MKIQTVLTGAILILLFFLTIIFFGIKAYKSTDELIADHIALLAQKFNQIHRDCTILNFEHQKNFIDFLNVISFEGSEIGPMNLAYPKNWKGPYLPDNPTIQEKYYQVVKVKDGYYVVPGPGVRLNSGLIIGENIEFNEDTDIQELIARDILRTKKGRPLAQQIMQAEYHEPLLTSI